MSLMRGEYRHPKYVSGWLKLFLHIAFYTVVRRKTTRERKRICRTWKNLLETASAASLKTAITPAHCSTPPSLPSRLSSGLPQPYGISITPICVFPLTNKSSCIYPDATVLLNPLFSIVKDTGAHFQSLPPRLHLALTCRHTYRLATIPACCH